MTSPASGRQESLAMAAYGRRQQELQREPSAAEDDED
jgi:hypothetical protein